MKTASASTILALAMLIPFAPANAEESSCSRALEELSFALEAHELPQNHLVERIDGECPADVGQIVGREIGKLKIDMLTSQVHFLDASRLESYDELKRKLGRSGAGKRASGNQAFGVALQALKPVLSIHLQQKLSQ